jgi:hypothetical protein
MFEENFFSHQKLSFDAFPEDQSLSKQDDKTERQKVSFGKLFDVILLFNGSLHGLKYVRKRRRRCCKNCCKNYNEAINVILRNQQISGHLVVPTKSSLNQYKR